MSHQRRNPSARMLAESPVRVLAYDLLELDSEDWRTRTLRERRHALHELLSVHAHPRLSMSPLVVADAWAAAGTSSIT